MKIFSLLPAVAAAVEQGPEPLVPETAWPIGGEHVVTWPALHQSQLTSHELLLVKLAVTILVQQLEHSARPLVRHVLANMYWLELKPSYHGWGMACMGIRRKGDNAYLTTCNWCQFTLERPRTVWCMSHNNIITAMCLDNATLHTTWE